MLFRWKGPIAAVLCFGMGSSAWAMPAAELEKALQEFDRDPVKFMRKLPPKKGAQPVGKFDSKSIQDGSYIDIKNERREIQGRAGFGANDNPAELVDSGRGLMTNLAEMDKKNLKTARLPENPWSDFYWALYAGQLAFRYADPLFPRSKNWKENSDYVEKSSCSVDALSPAEKYDLLVGDAAKGLTAAALQQGQVYYNSNNGEVEAWMGICHGWAPAAYMLARPASAITLTAADGRTKVMFYPSDIKALSSLLWAESAPPARFVGGRCNVKSPATDPANGRVKDQQCFDTNPGTWHMTVVNQIGLSKRSFVIDATFDYEVWNQPVLAYSYTYFNPQTGRPVASLNEAKVSVETFTKDKFKKYRKKGTDFVVGIQMDLDYIVETMPSTNKTDGPHLDGVRRASYIYDLELDSKGQIVGGEWYSNAHPDFLWTPAPGGRALTAYDSYLNEGWDGKGAMPRSWQDMAARASQQGTPMGKVVETLVTLSHAGIR